jgi:hypothetical protein
MIGPAVPRPLSTRHPRNWVGASGRCSPARRGRTALQPVLPSSTRSRTSRLAVRRRARNSASFLELAAAYWTSVRNQSRAGARPSRLARSTSGRLVCRAAVASAGAVTCSPYLVSAAKHVSRTRRQSFGVRAKAPSCRTRTAATWVLSSSWRTAIHRHPARSPRGAMPVRCIRSVAISAHSVSLRRRSPGAVRSGQCQTTLAEVPPVRSDRGSSSESMSGRTSPAGGSTNAKLVRSDPRQEPTRCGLRCSLCRPGP